MLSHARNLRYEVMHSEAISYPVGFLRMSHEIDFLCIHFNYPFSLRFCKVHACLPSSILYRVCRNGKKLQPLTSHVPYLYMYQQKLFHKTFCHIRDLRTCHPVVSLMLISFVSYGELSVFISQMSRSKLAWAMSWRRVDEFANKNALLKEREKNLIN